MGYAILPLKGSLRIGLYIVTLSLVLKSSLDNNAYSFVCSLFDMGKYWGEWRRARAARGPTPSSVGPSTNLKIDEFAASCSLSATIATAVLSTEYCYETVCQNRCHVFIFVEFSVKINPKMMEIASHHSSINHKMVNKCYSHQINQSLESSVKASLI